MIDWSSAAYNQDQHLRHWSLGFGNHGYTFSKKIHFPILKLPFELMIASHGPTRSCPWLGVGANRRLKHDRNTIIKCQGKDIKGEEAINN